MPTRLPPRREPRVLALARSPTALHWAVADPWELRGVGSARARTSRALALALGRLVRREKPTALVTCTAPIRSVALRVATHHGIPLLVAPAVRPPRLVATELYPEFPLFAPGRAMQRVAILAVAAVLHSPITARRYAPRRNRTAPRPAGPPPARP